MFLTLNRTCNKFKILPRGTIEDILFDYGAFLDLFALKPKENFDHQHYLRTRKYICYDHVPLFYSNYGRKDLSEVLN